MKKFLISTLFLFAFIFLGNSQTNKTDIDHLGLYNEILEQELEFPDIVFAQAVLESGSFTSKLFRSNNNLFGMRKPSKRITLAIGERHGYAIFEFWQESVADYALYQEHYFKNRKISRAQYLAHLNKTYSETTGYVNRLNRIIKEYSKILYEPPKDRNDGLINYYKEKDENIGMIKNPLF
jgi:uncharacterized FlgJ-related protein